MCRKLPTLPCNGRGLLLCPLEPLHEVIGFGRRLARCTPIWITLAGELHPKNPQTPRASGIGARLRTHGRDTERGLVPGWRLYRPNELANSRELDANRGVLQDTANCGLGFAERALCVAMNQRSSPTIRRAGLQTR